MPTSTFADFVKAGNTLFVFVLFFYFFCEFFEKVRSKFSGKAYFWLILSYLKWGRARRKLDSTYHLCGAQKVGHKGKVEIPPGGFDKAQRNFKE